MDAQRWAVIEPLYYAALTKESGELSSYLAATCADDPTLRSEVESLLAYADAQPGEQQKPRDAGPNLLILWRRGCIKAKIDPKNIGLCAADASLCAKTFGGLTDFATTCRRAPRVSAALQNRLSLR
jgi:hypothetical protein